MPTDSELLRQYARDRSEAAFAELVRRHIDLVYSAAVRRTDGDAHRAQEISQDVFIALAHRATVLAHHPALGAWLYASVRNAALNQLRADHRRQAREQQAHAMNEIESTGPDHTWAQLRPVLDQAMDELAESDRRAIVLRFFEDRSYAELGAALALREEAARMRVTRAMEKLRLQLSRRGITSTTAALSGLLSTHAVSSAPAGLSAAVAGTATAAAPATSYFWLKFIEIMTTTKASLALGGAAILILAGAALRNTLAETRLEPELAAAQLDSQQAALQLATLRRDVSAVAAPAASVPSSAAPADTSAARTLAEARVRAEAQARAEALMASHPEIRKAWDEVRLATTATGAVNLLRGSPLILSAEQQHELIQAMDGMNNLHNVYTIAGTPYAFIATGTENNEPKIAALVGGPQALQDLKRTFDPRNIASDLSAAALEQGAPLTGSQVQQVAQILAQNSADYRQGESATAQSIDWDAVAAQAQGVLTPAQQSALEAERKQVQFNVALRAATQATAAR